LPAQQIHNRKIKVHDIAIVAAGFGKLFQPFAARLHLPVIEERSRDSDSLCVSRAPEDRNNRSNNDKKSDGELAFLMCRRGASNHRFRGL
jgi:hypothetical protein